MATINFGGVKEEVITAEEFSIAQARQVLTSEVVAVLGYGVQGQGQALNLKDNGVPVIVGQRPETESWRKAEADGFVPDTTLFPLEEAARRGTLVQFLLSDAGQVAVWPKIRACLQADDALQFA